MRPAVHTHPAPGDALDQQRVGHAEVEHAVDGLAALGKHLVELLRLHHCAWEAICGQAGQAQEPS